MFALTHLLCVMVQMIVVTAQMRQTAHNSCQSAPSNMIASGSTMKNLLAGKCKDKILYNMYTNQHCS